MNTLMKKIFIICCICLFSIPLIFLILRVKITSKFSAQTINGNFERNFPLKEDYFYVFSKIKENVFQTNSIPDKVIQLNDGWLFCGDFYGDNLSESLHYLNFNSNQKDTLTNDLNEKNKWCNANKIKYFLAIAPNKEDVYSNLISLIKDKKQSKTEQLESICLNNNIGYINLGKNFPKNSKQLLYHKTDTHWNEYAGYFGYTSILDNINIQIKTNISAIPITKFKVVKTDAIIGDLNEMLCKEKNENLVGMEAVNYSSICQEINKKLTVPKDYTNDPTAYERRFVIKNKPLKIVVLCDSFGGYFVKFLREHFGETVLIWNHDFDKKLLLSEKPDIIIQEFVARNVDYLLKPNI